MSDTTKRVLCQCKSDTPAGEFQDKQYGKGVRIANTLPKAQGSTQKARCTVCSRVHEVKG